MTITASHILLVRNHLSPLKVWIFILIALGTGCKFPSPFSSRYLLLWRGRGGIMQKALLMATQSPSSHDSFTEGPKLANKLDGGEFNAKQIQLENSNRTPEELAEFHFPAQNYPSQRAISHWRANSFWPGYKCKNMCRRSISWPPRTCAQMHISLFHRAQSVFVHFSKAIMNHRHLRRHEDKNLSRAVELPHCRHVFKYPETYWRGTDLNALKNQEHPQIYRPEC